MTRLFLAAGVAALAIAAPASAKPQPDRGGGHAATASGGSERGAVRAQSRGGGGKAVRAQSRGGGGQAFRMQSRGSSNVRSFERRGGGQRMFAVDRGNRGGKAAVRVERSRGHAVRANVENRRVDRSNVRAQRVDRAQARRFERQQLRGNRFERIRNREVMRNQLRGNELRGNRIERIQNREALRDQFRGREFRGNRVAEFRDRIITRDDIRAGRFERIADFNRGVGFGVGGCPPGLASKGCMPPGQAAKLLGTPLSTAARIAALDSVPLSARFLFPDNDDFFYRFGNGYAYRVDRDDQLISALLPLAFGGGYFPGSYFPSSYMNSFVPNYYGFNSFYPDSPYTCNRYMNGLVYQVDCVTGLVEDVIPLYAGGYGVGQLLPTGYGYYNVPYQYRSMYYDTSDYGYWYAPGAIYQYDPGSSLITSVAALLSPGFTVGQPLPLGYDVYNVPYAYRPTYFDTSSAYYRYNNGYIYQVDPATMLVTAIVASILT
jgi:hypothetical protein